jgi:hypothetical protein
MTTNAKGADAFISTTDPILDLFTETRKTVPETIDEFTILVRKIERAKNHDSESFIKLLKFHRLIEKGNGMKGVYYICMMVLKNEDNAMYERVMDWSYQYPKDILRLSRLSSMFGCEVSTSGSVVKIPMSLKYTIKGKSKGKTAKKLIKWALTEKSSGHVVSSMTNPIQEIKLSHEIELYSQLLAQTIKKVLTGKIYDQDVNVMLFKYLSYETGHFSTESKIIWSRVSSILSDDPVVKVACDEYVATV